MADKTRVIDYQVQIHGSDPANPVTVELDPDSDYAAKVRGHVTIEGSSGAQAMFSIANRMETAEIATSINGWNTILNLTVPTGKTWYLKGAGFSSSRSCDYRMTIDSTTKNQGTLDASDSHHVPLYGFLVAAGSVVKLEINTSANQALKSNLIIYEETN